MIFYPLSHFEMNPTNWKCTPPTKWGASKTYGIIIGVLRHKNTGFP